MAPWHQSAYGLLPIDDSVAALFAVGAAAWEVAKLSVAVSALRAGVAVAEHLMGV